MYYIVPLYHVDPAQVQAYWQTLGVWDTLKYRLSDVEDPKWADVADMINRMGKTMYMIFDDENIIGEFMLENPTGLAMQSHFSTHPELSFRKRLTMGRFCVNWILDEWINPNTEEPFVKSLYGLTPVENRAACIYALKIGYKKLGILPSGIHYMGRNVDAMISVASRG